MLKPFEERLKQNAFGTVRDILHSGQDFNSVVLQVLSVHSHLELVTGEPVQFVNGHIILWTIFDGLCKFVG